MSSSGELKFCGMNGCYRDDGDGGRYCMGCKQFWCNKHTNHIFGSICVDCNNQNDDIEERFFDDCWREICSYGPDCPRECSGTSQYHDYFDLKEETIRKALQACIDKNGIECFTYHTHGDDFRIDIPPLQDWAAARDAILRIFK